MSVVFAACRDVAAVAPPLGLEKEATATATVTVTAAHDKKASVSSFLPSGDRQLAKGEIPIATVGGSSMGMGLSLGVGLGKSNPSSESSSSIGLPDGDSDSDGGEGEVASNPSGSLVSLSSLEESLPIKRGLSNNFSGKSRSFANLSEVSTVRDIEKPENPLNKRRRTMVAYELSKKSSFSGGGGGSGFRNITSMPVLALNEEEEENEVSELEEEGERDGDGNGNGNGNGQQFVEGSKLCFSLTAAGR